MTNLEKIFATHFTDTKSYTTGFYKLIFKKTNNEYKKSKNLNRQFKLRNNSNIQNEVQSPHKTNANPSRKIY